MVVIKVYQWTLTLFKSSTLQKNLGSEGYHPNARHSYTDNSDFPQDCSTGSSGGDQGVGGRGCQACWSKEKSSGVECGEYTNAGYGRYLYVISPFRSIEVADEFPRTAGYCWEK